MSRLFMNTTYLDEANGNTLLTHPPTDTSATVGVVDQLATTTTTTTTATVFGNETLIIQSPSNDDLSQSLSEYTDADESISAPTELLAEFLSAVMLRDYVNALKYCKLILQYEPNNSTARDFYPHILSKIALEGNNGAAIGGGGTEQLSGESDENYNFNYSTSSSNSDDINIDEVVMVCSSESEQSSNCSSFLDYSNSNSSSSNSSSCSSGGEELDEQALNRINSNSTESDQLPPSQSATDNNTSHSYSSLLLEEEEKDLTLSDISNLNIEDDENDSGDAPVASHSTSKVDTHQPLSMVAAQATKAQPSSLLSTSSPKSQPSTPLASKIVAMLRARVIPSKHSSAND